jgi:hypothetical protein
MEVKKMLTTKEKYLPVESLPAEHRKVLNLLGKGSVNPITVKNIVTLTGWNEQKIRAIVSEMTTKYGIPIGTGPTGYFIIMDELEQEATYRNLRSRALKILRRARAIKNMPDKEQLMALLEQ